MRTPSPDIDSPPGQNVPAPEKTPGPSGAAGLGVMKRSLKGACIALGLAAVGLPAITCWAEARLSSRDELFLFWAQSLALAPGLPGKYLRKCFYYLTLRECSLSCDLGFM